MLVSVGNVWANEETYTFTSKSWAATNSASAAANWTSGKDGNQMQSGRGVQITTGASGANATSPASLANISKIVVTYSTNANNGAGSISLQVGSNTAQSQNVTKTGGTADRTLEYNYATAETGSIKLTVTCTTNSIYVKSVTVTYGGGEEPGGGGTSASADVTLSGGTFADSKITWTIADGNITISQLKGTSSTAVNSSYISAPRVYKGHILSFEATNGYKISSISIKCDGTNIGNSMTAGTAISNNAVTDNTTAVSRTWATASGGTHVVSSVSEAGLSAIHIQNVATASNVQLRPTKITITYIAPEETTDPSITLAPTTLTLDDIDVPSQSITVTPSNFGSALTSLTGALYSDAQCNTPVTSGAWVKNIASNGDKTAITFSVDNNSGNQRQVYLKITASAGTQNATAVLPITQSAYLTPLTTMAEIFSAATTAGGTPTKVRITFNNWVVSGKSNNNAYVTDGENGLIIFASSHGFLANDKLSGTVVCKVQLYNGSSELTELTSSTTGLTVTHNGTVPTQDMDDTDLASLTGVNTGSLIHIHGNCSTAVGNNNSTKYYINGVQLYSTLYSFYSNPPEDGKEYDCTGVYLYYKNGNNAAINEILPRNEDDIALVTTVATPTFTVPAGEYPEIQHVGIECTTQDANIYYTLDGSEPSSASTLYTDLIEIATTTTIRAIAIKDNVESEKASATYTINIPLTDHDFDVTHHFSTGEGFEFPTGWSTTYAEHEITYTDDKVYFASANQPGQTSSINDRPVTKNGAINLILTNDAKAITAVRFTYKQWGTKEQTFIIRYSIDGGDSYSNFNSSVVESSNFAIQVLTIPQNANAIQVVGTNADNQVGLTSIAFDIDDRIIEYKKVMIVSPQAEEGTLVVKNGNDAISSGDDIEVGTTLTIETTVNDGYSLTGVSVKDENDDDVAISANNTFVVPDKDVTVSATYVVDARPTPVIDIDPMALKFGDVATITPNTITPAAAASAVGYSIKAGSDDCITLAGSAITAKSVEGTATIVASIAATDDYKAASFEFVVTVSDPRNKATLQNIATVNGDFDVDAISYESFQGDGTTAPAANGTDLRLYKPAANKTTGGYIVIKAAKGCTIDEVRVTNGNNKATTIGCSTTSTLATSGTAYGTNATVPFTNLNSSEVYIDNIGNDRMDIIKIVVYYTGEPAGVDHLILSGTYPTNFTQGDDFDHTGLEVRAAYDSEETDVEDVTSQATITPPNMDVAGEGKIVTVSYGGKETTYTINIAVNTDLDDVRGTWTLVKNTTALEAGMKVIIARYVASENTAHTMGLQKNNNRAAVASTLNGEILTPNINTKVFTLEDGANAGEFYLKTSGGEYLYNASTSGSSYLKTKDEAENVSWTIDVDENGVATIKSVENTNRQYMRYNTNGGDPLFNCYASGNQNDIALYTPKVENLRENLTEGKWGTICPANDIYFMEGASFYTLTYMEMQGDMPYKLFFDEIETDYLEGGKPYLFIAEGETIMGVRGANAAEAQNYNGFYGNISGNTETIVTAQNAYAADGDVINYYGLTNNTFTLLPDGTTVQHERAVVQVKNGALNCPEPVLPAPARPGARRVVAGNNAPAVATGCDEINASETPVKMMIDGQLFIIRGEKMFDATGRLVK